MESSEVNKILKWGVIPYKSSNLRNQKLFKIEEIKRAHKWIGEAAIKWARTVPFLSIHVPIAALTRLTRKKYICIKRFTTG